RYSMLGSKAIIIRITAAKYFPNTICRLVIGLVCSISIVPNLNSSLNKRMLTAGIKNIRIHGDSSKNGDRSANSESKILYSPGITHRNNPLATRNKPTTKYPTGEEKKAFISLRNIASILRFVFSSLILEDCLHSKPLVCREKE